MSEVKIVANKKPNFGVWQGEISDVDPREYRRGNLSDLWIPLREKRWQYVGIYTEDIIFGLAVFHGAYLGNIFCYLYDRKRDFLWEQERMAPMSAGIRVDRNVQTGVVSYSAEDERIRIDNQQGQGIRRIDVRLKSEGRDIDIKAEIMDDGSLPAHQVVTPTADDDFTFTHKVAGLPVLGDVRLGEFRYTLNPKKDRAVIDFTFGYPARRTEWNWLSMAGFSKCGKSVGVNLVNPILDTKNHENVFWIDGQRIVTGIAHFEYDDISKSKTWKISTEDGSVDLTFTALGIRSQDVDYNILSSKFKQPFGTFHGKITHNGVVYDVEDQPGVVEEHLAVW